MDKPNPEYRSVNQARHETGPVITPVESRQGIMTGRVRWILAISLSLVIIAFVIVYAVHVGNHAQIHSITASG